MNSMLEPDNLLYTAGGLLGIAAVIAFSLENFLGLSPVTRSITLLLGFAFFLPLGLRIKEPVLEKTMYGLAISSFLGMVYYINSLFNGLEFAVLTSSSIFLTGLGFLLREKRFSVDTNELRIYLGAVLLLAIGLILFDASAAHPGQSLVLDNSTSITGNRMGIGSMVVTNDFILPREFNEPEYNACIYGPEGEMFSTQVKVEDRKILNGNSLEQLDLWIEIPEELGKVEEMKVERAESCSPGHTSKVLLITSGGSS